MGRDMMCNMWYRVINHFVKFRARKNVCDESKKIEENMRERYVPSQKYPGIQFPISSSSFSHMM